MPISNSDFKPAWWLNNPHLQSVWGTVFKRQIDIALTPERIELDDGDFIDVLKSEQIDDKPIVLILHGMEGSINSHYAKPLIQCLENAGFAAYFMHLRGCSHELNRLPRGYTSGDSPDLQTVIEHIKNEHSRHPFAVIGFSLGGNVTLKWLGEQAENADTTVAVAVSVPFALLDCARKLENGFSRIYQRHLISTCQSKFLQKEALLKPILGDLDINRLKTFYHFDNKVTAPLNGYKSADDYYQRCSSRQFLKTIRRPTLVLHAKDDPFMWQSSIPEEHELSDDVELRLSEKGGHVGFFSGSTPWTIDYWLERTIVQWLDQQRLNS